MKDMLKMKLKNMTDRQFAVLCFVISGLIVGVAFASHLILVAMGRHNFTAAQELNHAVAVAIPVILIAAAGFCVKHFAERSEDDSEER